MSARALLADLRAQAAAESGVVQRKKVEKKKEVRKPPSDIKTWEPDTTPSISLEETVPTTLCIFYFAIAGLVSCLPVYIFTVMFGMGPKHGGLFGIISFGSMFILFLAYLNVAKAVEIRLNIVEVGSTGGKKRLREMDKQVRDRIIAEKVQNQTI